MKITFSLANSDDTPTLQHLWEDAHAFHHGADYLPELNNSYKNFSKKHERQFDAFFDGKMEDGEIFIAYNEDKPVGYTWLTLCSEYDDVVKLTEVFGVEKGLGKPAIQKAEDFARENGRSIIELESYEESVGFYEKMGFETEEDKAVQRPGLVPCVKFL